MTTDEDRILRGDWREIKSYRLPGTGIEKFEGDIENFILNTFINFMPVKRFENIGVVWVNLASAERRAAECNHCQRPLQSCGR